MPAQGDQHRDTKATANPFEENVVRISEYTAQEIATLQARLDRQLGPEYLSTRAGAGGAKVHYITGDKLINLANEVFGFNGWSSSVEKIQVDFVDETSGGKVSLGLSATIRVTLKDGTFHEDIGYGQIDNCKGKAAAFEKSKKEAVTDGLKRALRNFGNMLGNCLYDKDYLQRVSKIKVAPTRWDADNLHHHSDYAPVKKELVPTAVAQNNGNTKSPTSESLVLAEDEFGGNLFDEMEMELSHTDDVALDQSEVLADVPRVEDQINRKPAAAPSRPPVKQITAPQQSRNLSNPASEAVAANAQSNGAMPPPPPISVPAPKQTTCNAIQQPATRQSGPESPYACTVIRPVTAQPAPMTDEQSAAETPEIPSLEGAPVGFLAGGALLKGVVAPFNPQVETGQTIRRTIANSGKSEPITRSAIAAATASATNAVPQESTNFVNPAMDMNRKIGMPATGRQSPMGNRGAYKPLSVKRTAPPTTEAGRQPLTDMSNGQTNGGGPTEVKKQKLDSPKPPGHGLRA